MKRFAYICLGVMIVIGMVPLCAGASSAPNEGINWITFDEAQKFGEDSSRKFLLYFYTDWCTYCRKLEQSTFIDKEIAAYVNKNFIPVRINSEQKPKLAARYRINGVPNLRFLTPKGEDIAHWPGYIEAARFLPLLKYIQTDSYLKMGYSDFLKKP
jgi:thioredoxin-related protein